MRARGQRKPIGAMNQTEEAYAKKLENDLSEGRILWYKFEGIKLRLADNTFYTPDFFVMDTQGFLECHEVKGHWEDDARVKIKVAASLFPFKFVGIMKATKKNGGGWEVEAF